MTAEWVDTGDHRPNVYQREDGLWVYRASAVGGCERALWYARMGLERSPINEKVLVQMREGSRLEGDILAMFSEQYEFKLTHPQHRVDIPVVGTDAVISGAMDAQGHDTMFGRTGPVDAKKLGPDLWKRRGDLPNVMPNWFDQLQCYIHGMGADMGWMVYGESAGTAPKQTIEQTTYRVVEADLAVIARLRQKVRRVERAVASKTMPDCLEETFMCPYWQMHTGDTAPRVKVDDPAVVQNVLKLKSNDTRLGDLTTASKALRTQIAKVLEPGRYDANGVRFTITEPSTRRTLDKGKVTVDPIPEEWFKVSDVKSTVRLEKDDG